MPHRYPQQAALRDGRRVLLRPFEERDTQALFQFFSHLPEDRRRFAWDRIDDRNVVESWGQNVDYSKAFPLLALDGNKIVADATLHRRKGGPLRRVGRIKWLIDPEWREVGLGTLLVNNLISVARENGLRHLSCMLISDFEAPAIEVLEHLGFQKRVIPGYGADPDGGAHDMSHLVLSL